MITNREHEERMALYNMGLNDVQIGERLYLSKGAVFLWRNKNGLKANKKRGGQKLDNAEHARRLELYNRGMTDQEIGESIGLRPTAVARWRFRNHLLANRRRGRPNGKVY